MKKIILAMLLCGGIFLNSNAQVTQPLSLGVKAGGALSTSSVDDYTMRGGLAVGIVVDYNFTKNLFLRSGFDFMMKGGKYDQHFDILTNGVAENGRKTVSVHLNYIQLPVMIGYRSDIGNGVSIYGSGGLYGALAVYGKGRYNYYTNLNTKESQEYDSLEDLNFKKFDFGLVAAIGVEYQRYSVNIGYEYGLINLNSTKDSYNYLTNRAYPITNGASWHNMNATCTFGYKF